MRAKIVGVICLAALGIACSEVDPGIRATTPPATPATQQGMGRAPTGPIRERILPDCSKQQVPCVAFDGKKYHLLRGPNLADIALLDACGRPRETLPCVRADQDENDNWHVFERS